VSLEEAAVLSAERAPELVALDGSLKALAALDERKSRIVELRFFGGLTVEETAVVLKVSPDKVRRDWRLTKSLLLHDLERGDSDELYGGLQMRVRDGCDTVQGAVATWRLRNGRSRRRQVATAPCTVSVIAPFSRKRNRKLI